MAVELAAAGLPIRIVNPRQVRDFARATGRLAKTDPLDAVILAHYAAAMQPELRPLPTADTQALNALFTRRKQVVALLVAEGNRRRGADPVVQGSLERVLALLAAERDALETAISQRIAADPTWRAKARILRSVPGIGPIATAAILAALPELGTIDRRQLAALAGVAPFNRDSGKKRGKAETWGGRAAARAALYMATLSASQHNAVIHAFYQRLIANHKPAKVALIACERKLLTMLNAMVRDGVLWNPAITA